VSGNFRLTSQHTCAAAVVSDTAAAPSVCCAAKLLGELPVSCIFMQLKHHVKTLPPFFALLFAVKLLAELPESCIFPLVWMAVVCCKIFCTLQESSRLAGHVASIAPALTLVLLLLLLLVLLLHFVFCSQAAG
jgi:hypothetical protein